MKASREVEGGVVSDVDGGVGFDGEGGVGFEGGVVSDVEGGVGYDGGGGAGVQLSSRKSRRCPAIFGFVSLPVRYPQTCQLCYHAPIYDL